MSSLIELLDDANKYSAEEFIKLVSESDDFCKLGSQRKKTTVFGKIDFTKNNYSKKHLLLTNFSFDGKITFSDIELHSGLIFNECEFKAPISIIKCTSHEGGSQGSANENFTLGFLGCRIKGIYVANSFFENGISFLGLESEKSQIGQLSFNDVTCRSTFEIKNCLLNSIDFFGGTIRKMGLQFISIEVINSVRISPIKCSNFIISGKDSLFHKTVNISGTDYGSIIFDGGIFKDEIVIQDISISEFLSFLGAVFESEVRLSFDKMNMKVFSINEVDILDTKFKNGIQFDGKSIISNKLQINFSEQSSGVIDFRNTFFKEVYLKGINFNNSLFLRDCSYDKLTFSHFFNKALVSLNNNKPDGMEGTPSELLIENSNLGNTEFYDFDFSIYPSVRVIDSRLDNIFVYGASWFVNNQLNIDSDISNQSRILSQKREIYRQLKLAAEKQSDRITALEFKSREVETHGKLIRSERGKTDSILGTLIRSIKPHIDKVKQFLKNRKLSAWFSFQSDMISINLGKTNNHGQNWLLPFGLLILSTIIIYPLLVIGADPIISWKCDWSAEGWSLFWCKMGQYDSVFWQLFNPTRRVKDMFPGQVPASAHFWDGLQRIVLAFFIFQIVSAFRKFVK
ncbi:hypothetical protein ACPUEN_08430 [Algoriphagus yeomjeoni]|uniref:hypothetical protein n=1 Tax=Algoriphagus yeomjeoni TaxID=291403 RepID=UPI003CE507A9